ncbi:MAG: hypothetical protein K9G58_06390 [Bacteroidales bacterium]|nr:hypothetical protein [Bacteroidales bacterium]MCF8386564.1 hypothetical protein [Bacteroidales bacterium]MCF8397777.1 hypothetical protein [Bacteroidales bacterium]
MKNIKISRREQQGVYVLEKLGWKFHHMGIPTSKPMKNERYIPHLKMYVSGFESNPYGIEWMRFEEDCPLPDIIKEVPHPAFELENLDAVLSEFDFDILVEPNAPSEAVRVAMILHNGAPVELMEFSKK